VATAAGKPESGPIHTEQRESSRFRHLPDIALRIGGDEVEETGEV
jgi:hypothetical protein